MNRPVGGKWFHDDIRRGSHDEKLILHISFVYSSRRKIF